MPVTFAETLLRLLQSGAGNLAAYLAAHVLLCLVPAFFIAGALTALIPKEAITRFLGRNAPKGVSYPAAALAGSVLAVCSCTIVPLFAGIYRKGAGLGPAITFLFFAPAANILALAYTGVAIGMDLAIARLVLSLLFGIGIGLIMATLFQRDDVAHSAAEDQGFVGQGGVRTAHAVFVLLLVALLLAGTLRLPFLTNAYGQFTLPIAGMDAFQETLNRWVPYDASRGEEGVTVQGALLIALLGIIALTAWRGLGHVDEGYSRWTWVALAVIALTLVVASVGLVPQAGGVDVLIRGKTVAVLALLPALLAVGKRHFQAYEMQDFLWESWRFVRQIFPLLVVGVFVVGVVRPLIRPEWIESLAGSNTFLANVVGVLFGVFMYFPTLVEVPIANLFLGLGMHRGPLLAYLMADPELSLQSILITAKIIGARKAWVYVAWVALFSTAAGLAYGAWVDGASVWLLLGGILAGLAVLVLALHLVSSRERRQAPALADQAAVR